MAPMGALPRCVCACVRWNSCHWVIAGMKARMVFRTNAGSSLGAAPSARGKMQRCSAARKLQKLPFAMDVGSLAVVVTYAVWGKQCMRRRACLPSDRSSVFTIVIIIIISVVTVQHFDSLPCEVHGHHEAERDQQERVPEHRHVVFDVTPHFEPARCI